MVLASINIRGCFLSMSFNFCCYLDENYLSKFITLYSSTKTFCRTFYVLALDEKVNEFFKSKKKDFKKIKIITIKDLLKEYKNLKIAKKNRSKIEFYFTLSPYLPKFIFKKFHSKQLIYLDADIYFVNKLSKKFLSNKFDIQVVRQGFKEEIYGKFNVGFILYNNTYFTKKMLNIWAEECFQCCKDYPYKGTYADQKYLDSWQKYPNIKKLNFDQINVAPWNISQNAIRYFKKNLIIKNKNIICYHFHGLKLFDNYFISGLSTYKKKIFSKDLYNFYYDYVCEIKKNEKKFKLKTQTIRLKYTNNFFNNILIFIKRIKNYIYCLVWSDKFKI